MGTGYFLDILFAILYEKVASPPTKKITSCKNSSIQFFLFFQKPYFHLSYRKNYCKQKSRELHCENIVEQFFILAILQK